MPIFESTEKMKTVLGGLFNALLDDPVVGPKYLKSKIVIKYNITNPNATMWMTPADGTRGEVIWGSSDLKADVEMTLSGDTCHSFWLRHISMPIALAKGLVKTKGPMPKVLKLLPLLKPAFEMYPEHASAHGLPVEKP